MVAMPGRASVTVARIVGYLDDLLEVSRYDEGEPSNGLMVDGGQPVSAVAASVNTSFTSIRRAASSGAQLLLVHHTTWASVDLGLKERKEEALRDAGISLYCAHAALDCHAEFSNADTLARHLGVRIQGRFAPYCGGLAGAYGDVDGAFAEFADHVQAQLEVRVDAWQNSENFGRVGIVPGGAPWTSFVDEAQSMGCDTYLTGEGSMYTKLFARETGMNLIFATHYATEMYGVQALAERVARQFDLSWDFVREDPD
jgi:dinuclear metal center YbgI/SA1388 family protein